MKQVNLCNPPMSIILSLSFQFFDKRGDAAYKVFLNFGGHEPSPEVMEKYKALIERFAKPQN